MNEVTRLPEAEGRVCRVEVLQDEWTGGGGGEGGEGGGGGGGGPLSSGAVQPTDALELPVTNNKFLFLARNYSSHIRAKYNRTRAA